MTPPTTEPRGLALHIGVNRVDPAHYHGWDGALTACEHDASDMSEISRGQGLASTTLLTAEATATAVTTAIARAAEELDAGDLFLLTYAGHGSQVPDANSDEPDRLDETWVLYDRQLVDDELYSLWGRFRAGVRILTLSDSCHSGSVTRTLMLSIRPEALPSDIRAEPERRMRAMPASVSREVYAEHRPLYDAIQHDVPAGDDVAIGAHVLLLSGCQDNQTAADGDRNGLFTANLLAVWDGGKFQGGHRQFWKTIVERMPPYQSPNWSEVGPTSAAFTKGRPFEV